MKRANGARSNALADRRDEVRVGRGDGRQPRDRPGGDHQQPEAALGLAVPGEQPTQDVEGRIQPGEQRSLNRWISATAVAGELQDDRALAVAAIATVRDRDDDHEARRRPEAPDSPDRSRPGVARSLSSVAATRFPMILPRFRRLLWTLGRGRLSSAVRRQSLPLRDRSECAGRTELAIELDEKQEPRGLDARGCHPHYWVRPTRSVAAAD